MPEKFCLDMDRCKEQNTTTKISMTGPFPNVLSINLSYTNPQGVTPSDLLKVLTAIPNIIRIGDLFDVAKDEDAATEYQFKGMICFLGAHYVSFFRSVDSDLEYDPTETHQ
jgi:hypothetical protein